jgi:hypothetical protein
MELAPVGSSCVLVGVLVRVGSGRSVLSLQGRELWGILIKGNYGIKAESSFETRESGHETERND